jgi:hypothetical protein
VITCAGVGAEISDSNVRARENQKQKDVYPQAGGRATFASAAPPVHTLRKDLPAQGARTPSVATSPAGSAAHRSRLDRHTGRR